jgi:acetolactate synthase-1/2/3 large subunit
LKKASLARSRFDPELIQKLKESHRPVILLGGGVSREVAHRLREYLEDSKIPVMTTWNGCDRYSPEHSNYWGRPNTWGQRSANILLQQADYLLAIGTRLGLQQTGFNWEEFVPNGKVVQIDIDKSELDKGHPKLYKALNVDANQFMEWLCREIEGVELDIAEWLEFGNSVRKILPLSEDSNTRIRDFINPYDFMIELSSHLKAEDVIIPSSSGGSETVTMQALLNPSGARVITSKGMASMGYGLSAAIGSAVASQSRVIHIEGDGGFAQNLQELGTVRRQNLPIKTFIFSNEGYASIRMTQKSYFGGQYMGCDIETGLGLPDWESIFKAYGIPCLTLDSKNPFNEEVLSRLASHGPSAFLVIVSPEQTYYPKISSRVTETGSMISNPLHLMYPALDDELSRKVFKYIKA